MSNVSETTDRLALSLHKAFRTLEVDGFDVRRAIPSKAFEAIGPFIFLDHFGPIPIRPGAAKSASAHPHAGIETLTLLLEGQVQHKDSLGNDSTMQPGEVQWMRAGKGIVHDEAPGANVLRHGGHQHGIQFWINMPMTEKFSEPMYRHVNRDEIPLLESSNGTVRLVAGQSNGQTGPVGTWGNPFLVHASLPDGGPLALEAHKPKELALYVMTGAIDIDGSRARSGELVRLSSGENVNLVATPHTEVVLVGGDPLDAPIVRQGPFVMNTNAQLEQTVRDYYAGKMGKV
ncbi:pirin family protein [Asticcacaulis sp. SL142]|uniref:pirin family protein n=1 Tax=Asticcacaulis sp. SL142 TaxID=2995155 RepID=UPI00226C7E99|nr:pirin family protein [Asticcacaulis sp. SL142]WAC48217.1 pirin family protein [Asticcacaulis sp. SL142]